MSFLSSYNRFKNYSDRELIELYLSKRDINIYGELFDRYMVLIYGVCLSILKEREWARDTVMVLFEKTSQDIIRIPVENFKNWIHVVSRNQCLMELRKRKPEEKMKKEISLYFMEDETEMHPLDIDEKEWDSEALKECIERLTAIQRQCIEGFYFLNESYREMAKKLETDEKSIKSFLQNGKRNLKICLEKRK